MECLLKWCCSLTTADIISFVGILIPLMVTAVFFKQKNRILTDFQKSINEHQEKIRVEYGLIYTKRLKIIEDTHSHILLLDDFYNRLKRHKIRLDENEEYKLSEDDSNALERDFSKIIDYLKKMKINELYFSQKLNDKISPTIQLLTQRIVVYAFDNLSEDGMTLTKYDNQKLKELKSDFAHNNNIIETIYNQNFTDAVSSLTNSLKVEFSQLIGIKDE